VTHIPPDAERRSAMGKVDGVMTGINRAEQERVIIADDDVRHSAATLRALCALLDDADLVRPQNYFEPAPWHALWDTARSLLNRLWGGDWPGTLAVRRDIVRAAGGYDGNVMFENLELERTVRAVGGRVRVALDCYVSRRPASAERFCSQRVRQAYDELARPQRLALQLLIVPLCGALWLRNRRGLVAAALLAIAAAETGRRRAGGTRYFPARATLFAPLWLVERGICSWLALGSQLLLGGVRYGGGIVPRAATPQRVLDARLRHRAA
jgi:hypothetical protein